MIRKFNYTDRHKIKRADIRISIRSTGCDHILEADIAIDAYRDDLPVEGQVYVEAYHRTKFNRFHFGTVGQIIPPDDRRLAAFSAADLEDILFRVKVVDESDTHGCILAVAEGVRAISDDERNANRLSLLGVDEADLGNRIWELDLEAPDIPWLKVNSRLPDVHRLLRADEMFFCSVYPEIIRQVLNHILFISGEDYTSFSPDSEENIDWQYRWLCFGKKLSNEKCPRRGQDETELRDWIESCVDGFCRSQRVLQRVSGILGVEE